MYGHPPISTLFPTTPFSRFVIVGRLIPAGTGLAYHQARKAKDAMDDAERRAIADAEAAELAGVMADRSEEHTSELQSPCNLVCRLLLEKKTQSTDPPQA